MSRIRTIKPEAWVSEQLGSVCRDARLLFIGMWSFCDDRGVHPAKSKTLKAEVFPMDEDVRAADVERWIYDLIGTGLVVEFEANGSLYWHVTGWAKHQRIDKPTSKHPEPPLVEPPLVDSPIPRRGLGEEPATATRGGDDASASGRGSLAPGVEGIGVDGIGETPSSAKPTSGRVSNPTCNFDGIVSAYHEKLPQLVAVRVRTKKRIEAMRKRWQWVLTERREDGTTRASSGAEALAWFIRFFERAAHNDFIMGRTPPSAGHESWRADLDYLMSDKGLVQVLEKTEVPA